MSTECKWFIAEALFQAAVQTGDTNWEPLVEDLLFLVHDIDEPSAMAKAEKIARRKEHSYKNSKGQCVVWSFARLVEVKEIIDQRFEDGAEIRSTLSGGQRRCVQEQELVGQK